MRENTQEYSVARTHSHDLVGATVGATTLQAFRTGYRKAPCLNITYEPRRNRPLLTFILIGHFRIVVFYRFPVIPWIIVQLRSLCPCEQHLHRFYSPRPALPLRRQTQMPVPAYD